MRRPWTFLDTRNKYERREIQHHNTSVTRRTLWGSKRRPPIPKGWHYPDDAPPQIRELTGHFALCVRLIRIASSTPFSDLKNRPLGLVVAPYAPADIVGGMLGSKQQYRVHSVSILIDNYKDNTLMDDVLLRVFEKMPRGIMLQQLRVADINLLLRDGYVPQDTYLVDKIGLLRVCNCPGIRQFMDAAFTNSDMHTLIGIWTYKRLKLEVRDRIFDAVTRQCAKFQHFCFRMRRDELNEQIKTAMSAPGKDGQMQLVSRKERKKARQSEEYGTRNLLHNAPQTLKTLSLRIGERSEVPDQELRLLGSYLPDLSHIGIPCPVLSDAIKGGHLNDGAWKDVHEQTAILSTVRGLEYLHLFIANPSPSAIPAEIELAEATAEAKDGEQTSPNTKPVSRPTLPTNITPFQSVAYEVPSIVANECKGLEYLSITVRDFVDLAGKNPDSLTIHLNVNRDDMMKSKLVGVKELGINMELYGDLTGCTYEGLVETKTARWVRPKY